MKDNDTIYTLTPDAIRALDDAALNVTVARARGYTIHKFTDSCMDNVWWAWEVIDPSGQRLTLEEGAACESDVQEFIPDVATNTDAALALVSGLDWTLTPHEAGGHEATIERGTENQYHYRVIVERAANPARALATAWIMWKRETANRFVDCTLNRENSDNGE